MQTIIKAADDAALLALMPQVIGLRPRNSIVLLGFLANRTHGALRFDLPAAPAASPALVYKRFSKALVGTLSKLPGADGVVIAVVTDEAFGQSPVPPHLDFVAELTRYISRSRFALKAVLCQASDGWAPYFDPDVPIGGYPLADIIDADIASQLPPDLPDIFDSAQVPSRVPDAPNDVRSRVISDFSAIREKVAAARGDARQVFLGDTTTLMVLTERALTLSDEEFVHVAGHFLYLLQINEYSDPMMLQWASDADTTVRLWAEAAAVERAQRLDTTHFAVPRNLELVDMRNGHGSRPDPERLERAIQFVRRLVSCADDTARLRPLTILAWLHWALGRGSLASVYLAEARTLAAKDPRVEEFEAVLQSGVLPPWLFESPDDDDDLDWEDDNEFWPDPDDYEDPDDWQDHLRNPF
jgi:hypothetical protein